MVAVAPTSAASSVSCSCYRSRFCRSLRKIWRWIHAFVGRLPGQYTVGKVDALQRFQLQTSRWGVALILILSLVPTVIANLMIEAIPLAAPAQGLRHSLAFQVRQFLTAGIQTSISGLVKKDCVPEFLPGSSAPLMDFGLLQGIVSISTNIVISVSLGSYPVPFSLFTPVIPMAVIGSIICYHRQKWGPEHVAFRAKCTKVDNRQGMEFLPIVVYPVFTAVFMSLPPNQQLALSMLLPVIKLALRRWLWLVSKDDQDLVGVISCCAGHLYHILFTSVILQNAKSTKTLLFIGAFNTLQMLFNCRYLLVTSAALNDTKLQLRREGFDPMADDVIATTLKFSRIGSVAMSLHSKFPSGLLSTYPRYSDEAFIASYSDVFQDFESRVALSNCVVQPRASRNKPNGFVKIIPGNAVKGKGRTTAILRQQSLLELQAVKAFSMRIIPEVKSPSDPRELYINHVTSALHQTEIILLRSYITIVTTSFYVFYLLFTFAMPNRAYFATLVSLTAIAEIGTTSRHLLSLCALEIGYAGVYISLIRRRLGVSGLCQLAFVLRSQWILVQAKFLTLSLMILGFPLDHYGNGAIYNFHSG